MRIAFLLGQGHFKCALFLVFGDLIIATISFVRYKCLTSSLLFLFQRVLSEEEDEEKTNRDDADAPASGDGDGEENENQDDGEAAEASPDQSPDDKDHDSDSDKGEKHTGDQDPSQGSQDSDSSSSSSAKSLHRGCGRHGQTRKEAIASPIAVCSILSFWLWHIWTSPLEKADFFLHK